VNKGLGVGRDGSGQPQLVELVAHDVLKHGPAHCHANRHAQPAHKGVHGGGTAGILDTADSLNADVHGRKEDAVADAEDGEDGGPDGRRGVGVEEHQEAAANGCDGPSAPDGPSVAASPGREQRDDDATREKKTGDWEDVQAGLGWSFE
jgi:hypothetical protein